MATIDWLLLNPGEICKLAVLRAKNSPTRKNIASEAALERTNESNVSDHDYRVAFSVLKERNSELMKNTLLNISSEYNSMRAKVLKNHPLFAEMSWSVYKLLGVSFRSPIFESMYFTEPDQDFARFYIKQQLDTFGRQEGFKIFESWDNFVQVDYDPDFLFGVGQYKFRDKSGHIMETIWDLKQDKLPAFAYAKEL